MPMMRRPMGPNVEAMQAGNRALDQAMLPPQMPPSRMRPPSSVQSMPTMAKGGSVKSASRGDGCARKGHTKGKMV